VYQLLQFVSNVGRNPEDFVILEVTEGNVDERSDHWVKYHDRQSGTEIGSQSVDSVWKPVVTYTT
jgi:hypothetical protein